MYWYVSYLLLAIIFSYVDISARLQWGKVGMVMAMEVEKQEGEILVVDSEESAIIRAKSVGKCYANQLETFNKYSKKLFMAEEDDPSSKKFQPKGRKRKKTEEKKVFSLIMGKGVLEAFQVLDENDMENVQMMIECIHQEGDPVGFYHSIDDSSLNEKNITYINHVFRNILPNVYSKIVTASLTALKRAGWDELETFENFEFDKSIGLRTATHVHERKPHLEEKKRMLREKVAKMPGRSFVISPEIPRDVKAKQDLEDAQQRHQKDEIEYNTSNVIFVPEEVSAYSIIILLTDSDDFMGGQVLVKEKPDLIFSEDDTEEYNEDHGNYNSHHIETALEKGGILIMKGNHEVAIKNILAGERSYIAMEFWQRESSSIIGHRANLQEGIKFVGRSHGQEL